MGKAKFDFSGYATKVNLKCSDGRVIKENAFRHNDGTTVPLVWQHQHSDPANVLGHALLENRQDGVYAYCRFNGTDAGSNAKELVKHGDITALSIHANQLKQNGPDVIHGVIREVSLVLAGANPGAFIENVTISHADGSTYEDDTMVLIHSGEEIELHDEIFHEDEEGDFDNDEDYEEDEEDEDYEDEDEEDYDDESEEDDEDGEDLSEEELEEILEGLTEEEQEAVLAELANDDEEDEEIDEEELEAELEELLEGLTEEEQEEVLAELAEALEDDEDEEYEEDEENIENDDNVSHQLGGDYMKRNVFEQTAGYEGAELTHADFESIMATAKSVGSFKEAVLSHATTYGIENIDVLFPDAKSLGQPTWIERETEWVTGVLSGTSKTPFSRIKSIFADMNFEEARARGYIKAHEKKETYFKASKRVTNPQTVYVKQKLDRDDIIDVTDFDVIAMVRYQLRALLNEELARAILIGDGRDAADEYKISEDNIRPIWTDENLFSIKVSDCTNVVDSDTAAEFVEKVAFAHKDYKGSGNPVAYMTPEMHTRLLWIKDGIKRRLYTSDAELCAALRVSKIVEVPHFEGKFRTISGGKKNHLMMIKVNLRDYNCGADKGGQIATFDDFDIDFNQYKYLMETRMSGALIKPYAAQVFEYQTASLADLPDNE